MSDEIGKNILAKALLESVEDQYLPAFNYLIKEKQADPYRVIEFCGIAVIHFVSGMENVELAKTMMELILLIPGDVNVCSMDKETPLHVAAYWDRMDIVKMLLDNNARLDLKDSFNLTPINIALQQRNYDSLGVMIEQIKCNKLRESNKNSDNGTDPKTPKKISLNDSGLLTIKCTNDKGSPYYVNITHRSRGSQKIRYDYSLYDKDKSIESHSFFESDEDNEKTEVVTKCNLYELTKDNLEKFTNESDCAETSRKSYIELWRAQTLPTAHRRNYLRQSMEAIWELGEDSVWSNKIEKYMNGYEWTGAQNLVEPILDPTQSESETYKTAEDTFRIKSPDPRGPVISQVQEEFVLTDVNENIQFRKIKVHPSNVNLINGEEEQEDCESSISTKITVPLDYDTDILQKELTTFGIKAGPITKSTKRVYLRQLVKFKKNPDRAKEHVEQVTSDNIKFSFELCRTFNAENGLQIIKDYMPFEAKMVSSFQQGQKFREGKQKTSFIYVLIDPRISDNLPGQAHLMDQQLVWKQFVESIFYVGKGKNSRPYAHLYEAMKFYSHQLPSILSNDPNCLEIPLVHTKRVFSPSKSFNVENQKINRIMDIWKAKKGIICVHLFHNIIPAEAFTREGLIIEAIGIKNLTNRKKGEFYGLCRTWPMRDRRKLGTALLYKALQIFLAEGENQILPIDLI